MCAGRPVPVPFHPLGPVDDAVVEEAVPQRASLARSGSSTVTLTKRAMHGGDFNPGRTWVGANAGFHLPV